MEATARKWDPIPDPNVNIFNQKIEFSAEALYLSKLMERFDRGYVTPREAAELLGTKQDFICELINRGLFPGIKSGTHNKIPLPALARFMTHPHEWKEPDMIPRVKRR